jgi:ATP-dependent Clp protease adaptor protein ClpS
MSKPFSDPKQTDDINEISERYLILHNDEVHTFDYVIDALVDVCDHQREQAEQCAMITHFKGKCDVKKGATSVLRSKRSELSNRGLIATID